MKIKSKLLAFGLLLSVFAAPCMAADSTNSSTKTHSIKEIHAQGLKSWIDSGKKIQIIDARPKKFAEGHVIAGAKLLPYDSDKELISKTLPSKDATIVVYCASIKCPASKTLANQLLSMGYKNVYRYPEGIDDWQDKYYPVEPIQKS